MPEDETAFEREQIQDAADEAAAIGGRVSDAASPEGNSEVDDPAQRPLDEAGEGESEGFEEAERELIERASHGDQHAARRVIQDAAGAPDDPRNAPAGEPDTEEDPDA